MSPMGFDSFGKTLMILGIILLVMGALLHFGGKINGLGLGRLPGDIRVEGERFSFYFPIVTSIVLSIILTVVLNFFTRR